MSQCIYKMEDFAIAANSILFSVGNVWPLKKVRFCGVRKRLSRFHLNMFGTKWTTQL